MSPRVNRAARGPRVPRPLDEARLNELALAYVARFATSGGQLERYLKRKLRERGWDGADEPDTADVVARLVDLRYVDDATYAAMRSGSLLRRGYGARRIDQALGQGGIAEDLRAAARPGDPAQRQAALALARKRRFGPFGTGAIDRPAREKQLAAMLRAGHRLDSAREIVDAPSIAAAEQWVAEAEHES